MIGDDQDLSIKSWRNKNPTDIKSHNDYEKNPNELNGNNDNKDASFHHQQSSHNYQNTQQSNNSIKTNDEPFGISVYILLISTLVVIVLFLNCYRKGRNNIRTRRKYVLLNKLGL